MNFKGIVASRGDTIFGNNVGFGTVRDGGSNSDFADGCGS